MNIIRVALFVFLFSAVTAPAFTEETSPGFPCIGIVTASKLFCRKSPDIKSEQIGKYNFANPVVLVGRSSARQKVGTLEDYWYQDRSTKGWLFGGYLLLTPYDESTMKRFSAERIWCNVACGGFSCAYEFEPYLIGDYYIAYTYPSDYPQAGDPYVGLIIGAYTMEQDRISFARPLKIAAYLETGEWVGDYEKKNLAQYADFRAVFRKVNDSGGEFYVGDPVKSVLDRKTMRAKCKDQNNTEEIWYGVHVLEKAGLSDFNSIIPFKNFKIQ